MTECDFTRNRMQKQRIKKYDTVAAISLRGTYRPEDDVWSKRAAEICCQ
jgi:hypothetical protein